MMDSARTRTVGSSSTTSTVVGFARLGFIPPTPWLLKAATTGQNRSSNSRSYLATAITYVTNKSLNLAQHRCVDNRTGLTQVHY
jgi:hypothetical protein